MKNLALFDFDGTITRNDTMFEFFLFKEGFWGFMKHIILLLPTLIGYKLNLISNTKAKEAVLGRFLKNMSEASIKDIGYKFSKEKLPSLIREKALECILWHKQNGHDVYIVSASLNIWLSDWCNHWGVNLLSSVLEIKNGCVTGKLSGANCYGQEKVNLIKKNIDLGAYNSIYAYGDSNGDKEMLALANIPSYKPFR